MTKKIKNNHEKKGLMTLIEKKKQKREMATTKMVLGQKKTPKLI